MPNITTPKINNPQNFKSSNTLVTTRKPHYATKVDTAFNIVPGMHRPNANNVPNNLEQHDFIGPEFKARPLKHWRRQLVPTKPSSDNSTQKRMSRVYFMDTPGSTIYKTNDNTCKCIVDTGHNSFEIAEAFNKNYFANGTQLQNDGQIDVPSFYLSAPIIEAIYNDDDIPGTVVIIDIEYANDEPTVPDIVSVDPITPLNDNPIPDPEPTIYTNYHIYTGVFDSNCIACNLEANVIKSGITTQSQSYYGSISQYLESRCRTYAQRESTTKVPGGTYYPSATNNIPFTFLYPDDDPRGPQVYEPKNCANPKIYNYNPLNTSQNNYCSTIYKPNNPQFARQGAVSGSTRLQKLKSDTITSNGFSYYSAYGATMANAGNFQGTNESNNYFVKNRNFPLTQYIALNKYRQNKLSGCCFSSITFTTRTIYDWRNIAIGQSKIFTISGLYQPYQLEVGYNITITYSDTDSITGTITAIAVNDITLTITAFTRGTYVVVPLITTTGPQPAIAGSIVNPVFNILPSTTIPPNQPEIVANTFITDGECYLFSVNGDPVPHPVVINIVGTEIQRPTSNSVNIQLYQNPPTTPTFFTFPSGCFVGVNQIPLIEALTSGVAIDHGFPVGAISLLNFCGVINGYTLPYAPLGVIIISVQ